MVISSPFRTGEKSVFPLLERKTVISAGLQLGSSVVRGGTLKVERKLKEGYSGCSCSEGISTRKWSRKPLWLVWEWKVKEMTALPDLGVSVLIEGRRRTTTL